jgi:hypothetical protein
VYAKCVDGDDQAALHMINRRWAEMPRTPVRRPLGQPNSDASPRLPRGHLHVVRSSRNTPDRTTSAQLDEAQVTGRFRLVAGEGFEPSKA